MSSSLAASAWANRIVVPIAIFLSLRIIRKELKNRKKSRDIDIYQKWLNWSSMATMIFNVLQMIIIFLHKIPWICLYSYIMMLTGVALEQNSLALYQTVRLQYCFSSKRVHSNFGYKKYIFISIYIIIILIYIYIVTSSWSILRVHDQGIYGCSWDPADKFIEVIVSFIIIGSIVHITILLLYVIKLRQIKNENEKVVARINYILQKIILLTLLNLFKTVIIASLLMMMGLFKFDYGGLPLLIISMLEMVINVYLMYLMIERNDEEYAEFVRRYRIYIICCCFNQNTLQHHIEEMMVDENKKKENKIQDVTCIDTKTEPFPEKIEYKDVSLMTRDQ